MRMILPLGGKIQVIDPERVKTAFTVDSLSFEEYEKHDVTDEDLKKLREKFDKLKNRAEFVRAELIVNLDTVYVMTDMTLRDFNDELRLALNPNLTKRKRAFFNNNVNFKLSDIEEIEDVEVMMPVKKTRVKFKDGRTRHYDSAPEIAEVVENKED